MDTIENLYYGNIQPHVRMNSDPKLVGYIDRHESWLKERLEGKALESVEKLIGCYSELNCNTAYENFRDGFILGAQMVMDILYGREKDE